MSHEASSWALDCSKSGRMDAAHRLVLLVLANHAHGDGRYAFPSQTTIATRLGITTRSVRRSLEWLEENGAITRGDQDAVSHHRADRRPVVWDLPIGRTASSPRTSTTGRATTERPDEVGRHDRTRPSAKPSTKPPKNNYTPQTPRPALAVVPDEVDAVPPPEEIAAEIRASLDAARAKGAS